MLVIGEQRRVHALEVAVVRASRWSLKLGLSDSKIGRSLPQQAEDESGRLISSKSLIWVEHQVYIEQVARVLAVECRRDLDRHRLLVTAVRCGLCRIHRNLSGRGSHKGNSTGGAVMPRFTSFTSTLDEMPVMGADQFVGNFAYSQCPVS